MEIIDITNKLSKFEKHLNLNSQTIVSAKFGDGKTYFLNLKRIAPIESCRE